MCLYVVASTQLTLQISVLQMLHEKSFFILSYVRDVFIDRSLCSHKDFLNAQFCKNNHPLPRWEHPLSVWDEKYSLWCTTLWTKIRSLNKPTWIKTAGRRTGFFFPKLYLQQRGIITIVIQTVKQEQARAVLSLSPFRVQIKFTFLKILKVDFAFLFLKAGFGARPLFLFVGLEQWSKAELYS